MLDPEPQLILDIACTRVGNRISAAFVGGSIGQREAVVSTIAECLGMTTSQIDVAVAELIANGLLTNQPNVPESYSGQDKEHLGITHQGWQQWSGFEQMYLDDWSLDSVDQWLALRRVPEESHRFSEVFTLKPEADVFEEQSSEDWSIGLKEMLANPIHRKGKHRHGSE